MDTVNLVLQHNPKPLGDRIDAMFLANMISEIDKLKVNVVSSSNDLKYINQVIGFADVTVNRLDLKPVKTHTWHYKHFNFYLKYSKQITTIPLQTDVEQRDINLPNKFVTAQWDAGQQFRNVAKWDPDRITKIEQHYKEQGYDIVRVGGESNIRDLKDIVYAISKADIHIGADSGMMHLAKFLLPIENIHVYINIRNRYDDERFPDNWNVSFMAREIFRRGAKMNFCEDPVRGEVEYFKDVEIFNGAR